MRTRNSGIPLPHLAAWRRYEYLSQSQLADLAGISQATVKNLEHGGRYIGASRTTLAALANALRITPRQLVDHRPPTPDKSIPPDIAVMASLEPFVAYIVQRVLQELQTIKADEEQ